MVLAWCVGGCGRVAHDYSFYMFCNTRNLDPQKGRRNNFLMDISFPRHYKFDCVTIVVVHFFNRVA